MILDRLLTGAALAALVAGSALAQTGGSTTPSTSPTGMGAMQSPATAAEPYAPPPTTGGPPDGAMAGAATSSSAAANPSAGFTPIQPMASSNIIATLKASGEFTKLVAALDATNLTGLVSTHANLTLFAPTDAAFAALPPGQLDTLMKSPAQLQALLTYHLVATTIKTSDVKGHAAGPVMTAAKKNLTLDGSGPMIKVNDATALQAAVTASNGVIYPIDKVLTPAA